MATSKADELTPEELAQATVMPTVRRPLVPAPAEGPVAAASGQRPAGTPEKNIGGMTLAVEVGKAAPLMEPSPASDARARFHVPAMWHNPNMYGFPLQGTQERDYLIPLLPVTGYLGDQTVAPQTVDWTRPTLAGGRELIP